MIQETLDASEGSSNGSGRNFAYLDNSDPSVLQYNQIQTSLYPSNDLCEIDKISNGRFHTPSQLQPTKDNFEVSLHKFFISFLFKDNWFNEINDKSIIDLLHNFDFIAMFYSKEN